MTGRGGRIEEAELEDLKRRVDIVGVIQPLTPIRRAGHSWVGPCPFCGGSKSSTRFEVKPKQQKWVCAACEDGGDVIKFVMRYYGTGFREAVDHLGGTRALDEGARRKLDQRAAARARDDLKAEEKAVARAREIWEAGDPLLSGDAKRYFAARGIPLAPSEQPLSLRFAPALDYWFNPPAAPPVVIHRGPAILAAIVREGGDGKPEFRGCHCTYLNAGCDGKLILTAPDGEALPAKKVRGRSGGGAIRMTLASESGLLVIGEGIETTRTALLALRKRGIEAAAWAGVALGNMSGAAAGRGRPHPEKPDIRIPGTEPDMDRPGLLPPRWAREIVLLGDGDSDAAWTAARMECAAWRFTQLGFATRIAWAADGMDFNDMVLSEPSQRDAAPCDGLPDSEPSLEGSTT